MKNHLVVRAGTRRAVFAWSASKLTSESAEQNLPLHRSICSALVAQMQPASATSPLWTVLSPNWGHLHSPYSDRSLSRLWNKGAPPPTLQHLEGVCGCSAQKRDDFLLKSFRALADNSQSSTLPTPPQACGAKPAPFGPG